MLRRVCLLVLLSLCGCATSPPTEVVAEAPADIEIKAWICGVTNCVSRQDVADQAQAHCQQNKQNAQYIRSSLIEDFAFHGELWWFEYQCV